LGRFIIKKGRMMGEKRRMKVEKRRKKPRFARLIFVPFLPKVEQNLEKYKLL
jgi:hypothetical protein